MHAHATVAVYDRKGIIIDVNDRFCELSQYSREELIGQHHRLLRSCVHDEAFYEGIYETLARNETWSGDFCCRAKDGSRYWAATSLMPIYDAAGTLDEIVAIQTDITQIKLIDEELRKSNHLLNSIFEHFPGGVSYFDKSLILQMANRDFYSLLDLPKEELPLGCHFRDIMRYNAERGEYGEGDIKAMVEERVRIASVPVAHEFKRTTSDGRVLAIKGIPLPDGGFITTYIDVTDSEQMLHALEVKNKEALISEEHLRAARDAQAQTHNHLLSSINSMRNGFVIWSKDGRLILANDAFREVYKDMADDLVEGLSFESFLRKGISLDIWDIGGEAPEDWIERKLAYRLGDHRDEREMTLANGTQMVISERKISNGDTIVTLVDVTSHRMREAELKHTKDKLEQIAYFDNLTTLPNRACCQRDLDLRFDNPDPERPFAIVQIDLDNFKRFNDTMGHGAGDFLLKILGERLELFGRQIKSFKPYRWGGDEFVALIERDGSLPLSEICQELTDLIAIPLHYDGKTLWPTVSLGVARYPEDATDLASLMIFADLALYKTKELGRDGYQFFTAEMKEKVDLESRIEHELRHALDDDQLELYFQPQVSSVDERITGLEALIRWNHPVHGLVSPGTFLTVSENSGLASQLGCLVFDKAMASARKWLDMGLDFGRIALNLSPSHLQKNTLVDDFFSTMKRYDIDPKYLGVELLESCLLDDPHADISHILHLFRERGIHVELDDFGTGYASLSHLSSMPIDGIKIDRSFVQNVDNNAKEQAIIGVVMSMSKLMQLQVICEGVETHQQFDAVSKISKCSIQGYLVSRPLTFDDMTLWMQEERNRGSLRPKQLSASGMGHKAPAISMLTGKEVYRN
ncbi:MAG: EAL domain-containing protein [Cohaesibacter sp.]|nr:EAL domain-containing protein [Cohaesibacter sp.]